MRLCDPYGWTNHAGQTDETSRRTACSLAKEHTNINLIRLNFDQAIVPESLGARAVGIDADMAKSIRDIVSNM